MTSLFAFIVLNLLLYGFIIRFHNLIPFDSFNYQVDAHHYFVDQRINGGSFHFLRAMGQYDAQWYLRIANVGYPFRPKNIDVNNKNVMDGLMYAFFPLYPIVVRVVNFLTHNIELAAFLVSNVLMLANFASLYYILGKIFTKAVAVKTIFLLFLFPFSIFYRSYFAEGLQLLLLIWLGYFLYEKKLWQCALLLAALNITKPNSLLFSLLFVGVCLPLLFKRQLSIAKFVLLGIISAIPFLGWLVYSYANTGNPFYFVKTQEQWFQPHTSIFYFLAGNIWRIFHFTELPLHGFHFSQIDTTVLLWTGMLLLLSYNRLPRVLWWTSFLVWFTPLMTHDTTSFSRYQSVSFPLFVFMALQLSGWKYYALATTFGVLLFVTSLFFINWYFVG